MYCIFVVQHVCECLDQEHLFMLRETASSIIKTSFISTTIPSIAREREEATEAAMTGLLSALIGGSLSIGIRQANGRREELDFRESRLTDEWRAQSLLVLFRYQHIRSQLICDCTVLSSEKETLIGF